MKYVTFEGEGGFGVYETVTYYMEVDVERNMVVRQIGHWGTNFEWGEWNGEMLVGVISDQPYEGGHVNPDIPITEISADTFEDVWRRARETSRPD